MSPLRYLLHRYRLWRADRDFRVDPLVEEREKTHRLFVRVLKLETALRMTDAALARAEAEIGPVATSKTLEAVAEARQAVVHAMSGDNCLDCWRRE